MLSVNTLYQDETVHEIIQLDTEYDNADLTNIWQPLAGRDRIGIALYELPLIFANNALYIVQRIYDVFK